MENAELEEMLDTTDAWIRSRTGICRRHIAAKNESSCDMAEQAAIAALQQAEAEPQDIGLVVVATTTPHQVFPSTACLLQERLHLSAGVAFDVQAACAGFVYALDLADRFLRQEGDGLALVVGTDIMSRVLDWQDRSTCVLFGDGAGAVVLGTARQPGLLYSRLGADGQYRDLLEVVPDTEKRRGVPGGFLRMRGREVYRFAIDRMTTLAMEALAATDLELAQLDWLVPHQANSRIMEAVGERLGLASDRLVCTIDRHGNTSAASVPLALDCAVRDGRIQAGHTVMMEAFGSGFTWGVTLLNF